MNTIQVDKILVGKNRQRSEHDPDKHQELVESILKTGLLHPIVLRAGAEGYTLVAGERRLRAIREIFDLGSSFRCGIGNPPFQDGLIPFLDLGSLSPLEAEEAELEENTRRADLTWKERVQVEERLLRLRQSQAKAVGLPPPPLSSIVKELKGEATAAGSAELTRSVILARNLHRPEVAKATSAAQALKALVRIEETERNTERAQSLGKDFLGGKHSLFNANSLDWIKSYQGPRFNVICTDPPYGMGADDFGDSGGGAAGGHGYTDNSDTFSNVVLPVVGTLSDLTEDEAHAYIFCDIDRFHSLREFIGDNGWKPFRTPLLWFKPTAFRAPWPDQGPQRKYECILYAVKGKMKCIKLAGDVIQCAADENLGHSAQKPVALIAELLSRSLRAGGRVLDPFCGTGSVFPAAHALSGIATGVELDPASFSVAATRLEGLRGKGEGK